MIGFVAYDGAVGALGEGFLPDGVKQRAIHNWRLLTREDLILVFDLADIEVVAQHVVQRATPERDPTARRTRGFAPNCARSAPRPTAARWPKLDGFAASIVRTASNARGTRPFQTLHRHPRRLKGSNPDPYPDNR